jgi:hypothetical protein
MSCKIKEKLAGPDIEVRRDRWDTNCVVDDGGKMTVLAL